MYPPRPFQETDPQALGAFIAAHPLGVLTLCGLHGPDAYHLPFMCDESGNLHTHVARANPVWRSASAHDAVMVIFTGADGYISPGWYPSKQEHHRQVPTWNYQAVHARGRLVVHDDERYLRSSLEKLTHIHEAGQEKPWKMSDAPQDYIDAMVKAIVGVEIVVTELAGIMKLGQNKSREDITGAANGLMKQGDVAMGEAMGEAMKSLRK